MPRIPSKRGWKWTSPKSFLFLTWGAEFYTWLISIGRFEISMERKVDSGT